MRVTFLIIAAAFVTAIGYGCKSDEPSAETEPDRFPQLARAKDADQRANQVNSDKLELFATIKGPMPTGVAVSKENRVFTNFPRWGDPVEYTLGEIKEGKVVPFPSQELNDPN